jgi:hypothetical protein
MDVLAVSEFSTNMEGQYERTDVSTWPPGSEMCGSLRFLWSKVVKGSRGLCATVVKLPLDDRHCVCVCMCICVYARASVCVWGCV